MIKRLLVLIVAFTVAAFVAGCGGGGGGSEESANKTLILGNIGWTENVAVSNLTKVVLEEDLGYQEVELKTLDVGVLFEGVAGGDLHAFQDVWMPNHEQLMTEVEGDVEHLDPWYEGETTFGLAVPSYMTGVNSVADLNGSGAERIIGIEPGAVITTKIDEDRGERDPRLQPHPRTRAFEHGGDARRGGAALQRQGALRVPALVSASDVR
jgi:glycine betaine/proline transport system substrate-binding protein